MNEKIKIIIEQIPSLIIDINSDNIELILKAINNFKILLSVPNVTLIDLVINTGVIPRMIKFLYMNQIPQLQFEACRVLTNISSGTEEQTKVVVENGGIEAFVLLLNSENDEIVEQSAWVLGDIISIGNSFIFRDMILNHNTLQVILNILNNPSNKLSKLRTLSWFLSCLLKGNTTPSIDYIILPTLPILERLIYITDDEVVSEVCNSLSYITTFSDNQIFSCGIIIETLFQLITNSSPIVTKLIALLSQQNITIQKPALITIYNILKHGTDQQRQIVLNLISFSDLVVLLKSSKKSIIYYTLCIFLNIITNLKIQQQIDYILSNQALICQLFNLLNSKFKSNLVISKTLDLIEMILISGKFEQAVVGINKYSKYMEEIQGFNKLLELKNNTDKEVNEKVSRILSNYFEITSLISNFTHTNIK